MDTTPRILSHTLLLGLGLLGPACFSPGVTVPFGDEGTTLGSESTDGSSSTDDASTSDDTASEGAMDATPPEVVDVTPADGTSQVHDETITITFSEPMDQASVAAAFPDAIALEWDASGSQVELELPLPFASVPVLHVLVVPSSVTDLAGNGLVEPVEVTLELAALETVTLLHEPDLTGWSFDGSEYYDGFGAGDTSIDTVQHAAITFPLAGLESALAIRSATYRSQMLLIYGDVNDPELGGMVVDHVRFDDVTHVGEAEVLEAAFALLFEPGQADRGVSVAVDVTRTLESSWSEGASRFQLRFHAAASDGDDAMDELWLRRGADEDDSLVPPGFPEPDPGNQSRIEVEYFH